ncbi:phosphoribosylpyrophosphate synthetase [Candidatus Poribacteria bacterium]|nr:phosphoribosylpyrophosphate synthetase [Candidatus Poribacteria bacterium]
MENVNRDFRLFTGRANPELGKEIGSILGVELGKIAIATFPDSEIHVQIEESIRGADIYIVQPTCEPVNDNLMELLIVMDALKRASARQITAVIPYFGYARQDHKSTGREPISAKLVANLLASAGADRIISVDLHATQIQGFFDIPFDHLTALATLASYLKEKHVENGVIVSPDVGRAKFAEKYADLLELPMALMHKRRAGVGGTDVEVKAEIVGDVRGRTPIIIDDLIASGSIYKHADSLVAEGANPAYISITHPVLTGDSTQRLNRPSIQEIVTTNTIPVPAEKQIDGKVSVLSIAPLLAEAILRIHKHKSVSKVFLDQQVIFPV